MSGSRNKTRKVTKKNTTRKNTRSVSSVAKRIKKNAEENSVFADISEDCGDIELELKPRSRAQRPPVDFSYTQYR